MILELLLALLLGILAGTFTGLAPGIHINLIATILLSLLASDFISSFSLISLAVFIVSMSITHTFIDFIPSIFLGAPEEDTFLSVLPGHQMLKEGQGYQASVLTLYGSLLGLLIIVIFTPIFIYFLPSIFNIISKIIPWLLIFLSFYLIFREDSFIPSLTMFVLAGFLGFFTFSLPVKDPLLPLLSGLFGFSGLLISLKNENSFNKQVILKLKEIKLTKKDFIKTFFSASIFAPLCSFLPGIGSGHASTFASEFFNLEKKPFLFLNGAINTIIMGLSFVTIYSIDKARSGSAVAIKNILQNITIDHILIIIFTCVISGMISFIIGIRLSRFFALSLNKIDYKRLTFFVILFLILINIIFTNWLGLIVLIASTSLGLFCILSNSKRINLMASLILPAIIYYLFN